MNYMHMFDTSVTLCRKKEKTIQAKGKKNAKLYIQNVFFCAIQVSWEDFFFFNKCLFFLNTYMLKLAANPKHNSGQ